MSEFSLNNSILISQSLLSGVQNLDYKGYDPYDFLNSTLFHKSKLDSVKLFRLLWIQLGKRSPINVRPLIGVPESRNPKGIALFILGMLEDHERLNDEIYLQESIKLADWLITQQCSPEIWRHACWGYNFNWQARAFYVPKGMPNIITTCYVAQALYKLGISTESEQYIETALDAANFILKHLLTEVDGHTFFAYIPKEATFVHNANLWGSAWLAKAGVELGNDDLQEMAILTSTQSIKAQNKDGAWFYGERKHHQFIDGFHTGFNLEALNILRASLNITEFDSAISLGMNYYRDTFFHNDGTAKYYNNNVYPLDMHSFSQAVLTLLKVGNTEADIVLAKKIMCLAIDTMYLPSGQHFIYQRHRWFSNKINYTRWTQAWAYYGLACLNNIITKQQHETN